MVVNKTHNEIDFPGNCEHCQVPSPPGFVQSQKYSFGLWCLLMDDCLQK